MKLIRKDFLDCDLTKFPAVAYLALMFLVSRMPFIGLGFSAFVNPTDQDVLAVVNSAYLLRYYHIYTVSRFPGSPFYETINSLLIGGGWIATNAATMIVSFIAVILFGKILNLLSIRNRSLLLITFVFSPVIWINSTITMDYMWSLAFSLLAFYLVLRGKYNYAGIAIAFAIGSRLTSVVLLIPLLYWMSYQKVETSKIYKFLGISILSSIIIFSPVLYTYGLGFLRYYPREILFNEVFYGITSQLLSIPATLVLFIALIVAREVPKNDSSFNLILLVLLIYALVFIYHPSKPAYLIPAVPWFLIALSKSLPRAAVIIICVLIILNGIISVDVQSSEGGIRFSYGSVLKNFEERKLSVSQSEEYMESLSEALKKG
ncbi:MAG: hypothetical protein OIN66_10255 [Candidatus Methanoperedens sp.]|nr:hypothetical protein [Candidatus Methanoperedens sp.]